MTEFGKTHLENMLRVRMALLAGGGIFAVLLLLAFNDAAYAAIAACLALNASATFYARGWQRYLGAVRATRLFMLLDLLSIALAIFFSGGIPTGFGVLYVLPPFVALLLLGRQDAMRLALLSVALFLAQLALDLNGVRISAPTPPLFVSILGHSVILALFLFTILKLTAQLAQTTRQARQDKNDQALERMLAEQTQSRWTLINDVALRVQESTTPAQVYTTIGTELERRGWHCAVLEWATPAKSMRIVHISLTNERLQRALELFQVDFAKFDLPLERTRVLATAIAQRAPALLQNSEPSMPRIFPKLPTALLSQLLPQFEMKTMVFAPMVYNDQVNGVLMVFSNALTAADVAPLAALANQAGSALEKARLLSEQRKRTMQLEIVSELAARVSAAGALSENLQAIVARVRQEFGYLLVGIFEVDHEKQHAIQIAGVGALPPPNGGIYTQSLQRGILGLVARTGEYYLTNDTRRDENYWGLPDMEEQTRSELTLPFKHRGVTLGLLDVQSAQPNAFDRHDVTALTVLAEQIGNAFVKARALAAEQKRAAHLAWVSQVAAQATAFPEPELIIRELVDLVRLRFGYHQVAFATYDAARQELTLVAASANPYAMTRVGEHRAARQGLMGLAAWSGQSVWSGNVHQDERCLSDTHLTDARSALCVPFSTAGQMLGVLEVTSLAYDAFDGNDIGAMETLAAQLAAALERAYSLRLAQRRSAQLALVNQIASRLARLAPAQELLQDAVTLIRSQFGYFNVSVFENEIEISEGTRLVANAGALGNLSGTRIIRLRQGIVYHVATTGATYLCRDTQTDARYCSPLEPKSFDPVKSEIALPLRRNARCIGVLDIQSERRDEFTETDVTTMEILADQLATAMENARLFESEAQRAAQLDAVRVLTLKVAGEHDLDALLHSILSSAVDLVDTDAAALNLVSRERDALQVYITHNLPNDYTGRHMRFGEGLAGAAALGGETIIVDDYARWDRRVDWFSADEFAAMMAIPLKWQTRVLGVIELHRRRGRARFSEQELHLAGLFAAQAAIALENADLLEQAQARLRVQRALAETSVQFLALTEPQAILEQVTRSARTILDSSIAVSFRAHGDGKFGVAGCDGEILEKFGSEPLSLDWLNILESTCNSQTPTFWQSVPKDNLAAAADAFELSNFQSGIAAPLQVSDSVIGVIVIARRAGRAFDLTDAQTLALLTNQTANALERADAFRQERQRMQELNLLFEGFRATASTLEPDQVIQRLLEQLATALDVTSSAFVRLDHARRKIIQTQIFYAATAAPQEYTANGQTWDFETTPGLERLLTQTYAIVQADDPDLTDAMRVELRAHQWHTILRVPLFTGGQALGYISLRESRAPRAWDRNQILFAQTMASQAAVALTNAELYQAAATRTREMQALYEAGRALNQSLDVKTLCENSVNALCDILGYQHVSIFFVVGEFLELQMQRGFTAEIMPSRIPLTQGVMARAVRARDTMFVPDISTDQDFVLALRGAQAEIAVPLLAGDRVLGVLNVETQREEQQGARRHELNLEDVRTLNTFANQLVTAIENARLFQETQRHLKQVRTLNAASQVLNSELEWEAVLGRVAWQFLGALNVDGCTLFEWQRDTNRLVILAQKDADLPRRPSASRAFPIHAWFTQEALGAEKTIGLRLDDAADDITRAYLTDFGWQAALLAPLWSKGQVVGLIELGDRAQARHFSAEEMALAKSLALQAAIALENAKLYRDAQRRLHETETLYHYTRALSGTLDAETLSARALETVARLIDFDFGEVCLARESDRALVPIATRGVIARPLRDQVVPAGMGIVGWVAEHGRTVRADDVTRDPRYVSLSPHIMSEICLALRVGERTIGILNLEAKAPQAFDAHTEQLLAVFAPQLAMALENARLYAQTKRDAELKAVLLRELSHRVKNNLAAITSLLYMALDEPEETRAQILSETLGRVQSMATAHTLSARAADGFVDMLEVGAQVLQDTVRNLAPLGAQVEIETVGDHVLVAMRQLTTLALVLNELITNALRHGRNSHTVAPLRLRFVVTRLPDQITFWLQDDGAGLSPEFDLAKDAGLGLSLVRSLVEKDLRGLFVLTRRDEWTSAQVTWRVQEESL